MKKIIYILIVVSIAYALYKKFTKAGQGLVKNDDPTDPNQDISKMFEQNREPLATVNV